MKTKFKLRKKFRAICQGIPSAYRLEAAQAAAKIFIQHPFFKQSQAIACYLAVKHEFDCAPLIEAIWQAKKHCYVPVLSPTKENYLEFVRYDYGDALHVNRYAILEPVNVTRQIAPQELNGVIVPLLAFDQHGHRLGTGGGYYDRTFAFLHDAKLTQPCLIGLGYAAQQADALPSDPWDITLTGVITEKGLIEE